MNTLLETTAEDTADIFYGHDHGRRANGLVRIMVVDDDVSIRYLISEVLIHSSYEVDDAENAARAWKALHLKHYDLLITDMEMPGMTGLQLVHKLRVAGFELPVIFASGGQLSELKAKNEWLGFAATLPKPFTVEELVGTVKRILPAPAPDFNSQPWQPAHDRTVRRENFSSK